MTLNNVKTYDNTIIGCWKCGWRGKIRDCKSRWSIFTGLILYCSGCAKRDDYVKINHNGA